MNNSKQLVIEDLNKYLKNNFFGIDEVIDSITDKLAPWYIFPESLMRPMIINLWGMTGTGKTVLVREIAKYLKMRSIQVDLGEYVGSKDKDIGAHFYNHYSDLSEKPCIILIDEFHIARTVDASGAELDRQNIRGLWSLLSDGVIHVDSSIVTRSLAYVEWQLENRLDRHNYYKKYISEFKSNKTKDKKDFYTYNDYKIRTENPADDLFNGYIGLNPEDYGRILNYSTIKDLAKAFNKDFTGMCEKLKNKLKSVNLQPKLDFTKSLIFIAGNLDELYTGSESFDPDIDVNQLKERNKDITIFDVKENLTTRFRVEQISRLGNNHIIYPPLDEKAYYKIIEKDLCRIENFYKKKGITFNFDKSVLDIIYKEGVFPNQGARSILSTTGALLEPTIIRFNYLYKQKKNKKVNVTCYYDNMYKNFIFSYGSNSIKVKAQLSLDSYRLPVLNNKSVVCAVHEAGHIIASVLKLGIIPVRTSIFKTNGNGTTELSSKSYKTEVESFEDSINRIILMLAGQAAEKVIFKGNNICLGASSDIEKATRLILDLVQVSGYTGAYSLSKPDSQLHSKLIRTTDDETFCRDKLSRCMKEAEDLISDNLLFLKELSDSLLKNSFITKVDVENIMKKLDISICKKVYYIGQYEDFKRSLKVKQNIEQLIVAKV